MTTKKSYEQPVINGRDGAVIPATFIPAIRCELAIAQREHPWVGWLRRLRAEDIPVIRACIAAGEPIRAIAARYGVGPSTIMNIPSERSWRNVA